MKIRTLSHLQDALDSEFSWRLKEIADLNIALKSTNSLQQATLIRAGTALLYAHWEGCVKKSVEAYISFVGSQRLKYSNLASNFIVFGAKKHLESLRKSHKANINIAAVDFFLNNMSDHANFSSNSVVNTESNLSSEVFNNIILSVGIDSKKYEARYNLIDSSLLLPRNCIAHGDFLQLDSIAFKKLTEEVITLMRELKTDIENNACQGCYKR